MKPYLLLFLLLMFSSVVFGQSVPPIPRLTPIPRKAPTAGDAPGQSIQDNDAGKTSEVEKAEAKINQITESAGLFFKEGLLTLEFNRSQANEKFDKSVEVFLTSGVNVRSSEKLKDCYNQLLETIYRIEFPSNQKPQIKSLAVSCSWNISSKLADDVVALVSQPAPKAANKSGDSSGAVTGKPQPGFTEQKFEPSPLDELTKLELTPEEEQALENKPLKSAGARTVRAQNGDTVAKLAQRNGASPVEVAKFNGLLPDSVLTAGREIRIPLKDNIPPKENGQKIQANPANSSAGAKPIQNPNGTIPAVIKYLYETLNDPYSVRYVNWSPLRKVSLNGQEYWSTVVKFRAKNVYNAYILGEMVFYIRNGKVVQAARLN